jgi:hypothetical protein
MLSVKRLSVYESEDDMQKKLGTVKNPLSVIAIFAGIAEISGAAVLPHIAPENQELYIWFLMIFPFLLITFFFITLNWNYKVLYAPSDFENEDNFVNLQKASYDETFDKLHRETSEIEEQLNSIDEAPISENDTLQHADVTELKSEIGKISTNKEREERKEIIRRFHNIEMHELRSLEGLVLNKLQRELDIKIDRDMEFKFGRKNVVFDGVSRNGDNLTAFEFKKLNKNSLSMNHWNSMIQRWNAFFDSLNNSEKERFSLVFSCVSDEDKDSMKALLEKRMSDLKFKFVTRVYSYEDILTEQQKLAS